MRSRLNILIASAVMALVIPQFAMAENVEEQIKLMNERMEQMENQLQATQDELGASQAQVERQESLIEKAGLERDAKSGLAAFYEQVNISGWLAASYFYNFNNPDTTTIATQNVGNLVGVPVNGPVAPFHPDHNSFSVDQLWFEIEKPATEESRGGFRADILYGKTAGILGGATLNRACVSLSTAIGSVGTARNGGIQCEGDSANDVNVYQAYVEYLTPFGPSVKAGKMATWVGSEVTPTVYNYNITRGNVFNLLQPINHYGVTLDGETEGGITYGVGILNSVRAIDPDSNNNKSLAAKIGFGGDTLNTQFAIIWGREDYGAHQTTNGTADLVINWNPSENFSSWINATYGWSTNNQGGTTPAAPDYQDGWGIAAAGRYAFTERLGFALRGEYVATQGGFNVINTAGGLDNSIWGITGTIDYALTDNLMVKAEVRYDHVHCSNGGNVGNPTNTCNPFVGNGNNGGPIGPGAGVLNGLTGGNPFGPSGQWLSGVEVVYSF